MSSSSHKDKSGEPMFDIEYGVIDSRLSQAE